MITIYILTHINYFLSYSFIYSIVQFSLLPDTHIHTYKYIIEN